MKGSVFARMEHKRFASGVLGAGDKAHDDDMIAGVMGGMQVAFEGGERSVDQRHAAMAGVGWNIRDGGF